VTSVTLDTIIKTHSTMKAADLSQPVARKREGKVRWCKSAAKIS